MQVQQDTIDRTGCLNAFEKVPAKILEGVTAHRTPRNGTAKDRPDELEAVLLGRIHEGGLDGVSAPEAPWNLVAVGNILLGKLLHGGGNVGKRVGFVRKRPRYDAHILTLSAVVAVRGLSPHTSATSS